MKSLALVPVLLLCCAPLYAADGKPGETLPPGAAVETDPKYPPVVSYTLKNGLKLLILEKKFVPTVSFSIAFKVGNVDCPQGKTGLAHLFEHVAFKGSKTINTKDYAKEKIVLDKIEAAAKAMIAEERKPSPDAARLETLKKNLTGLEKEADAFVLKDEFTQTYKNLGSSGLNAATSMDYTLYMVSLPSNQLETLLAMEADRFKNPVLREFYRERSVVTEEQYMYATQADRTLFKELMAAAMTIHPYRNPIGGWMDDIKTLTMTDAEKFYGTFYVPNNATIAIVGDVKPAEVIRLAEKHFAAWKPSELPDTAYTQEPPQKAEKRFNLFFKATPSLRMGFHNPGFYHPDIYPLVMASEVLSGGKTARFYRNLVEGKQVALYASAGSAVSVRYPSLFTISAAPKAPHTPEELEAAIWEEIERLKTEPPTAWEMEKILNNHDADMVKGMENSLDLAQNLSLAEQVYGGWKFDWQFGEELRKVKPEDVSKAVAKYLVRENYTIGIIRPPAAAAAPAVSKGDAK